MKVTLQIVLAALKLEMDLVANLVTDDLAMPLIGVRTMKMTVFSERSQ